MLFCLFHTMNSGYANYVTAWPVFNGKS